MQTILIIEEDKVFRRQLSNLVEHYGHQAILTDDFGKIVQLVSQQPPHLIILGLDLPIYDGHQICRQIRQISDVPIIIIAAKARPSDELISLNFGADCFVVRPINRQVLMAKIENLLRRVYQPRIEAVISFNDLSLDIAKAQAMFGGQTIELTKNEAGLLRLLIENQGRVLARQSIIDVLWQSESFVDDNTLTVNVNRLRRKLAQIGAQQRLRTRRGLGYSLN